MIGIICELIEELAICWRKSALPSQIDSDLHLSRLIVQAHCLLRVAAGPAAL
jgi:hypothetical protein